MTKKRNRQQAPENGQPSEGSTDSCDEASSPGDNCPHIAKAVNLKIKKNIKKTGLGTECPTCKRNDVIPQSSPEESGKPGLWICLQCGNIGCDRKETGHAMEHYKKPHSDCHYLVADLRQWTVWCYQCETEINVACRKMLQETVEFLKKIASVPAHVNQPRVSQQLQKEAEDKEKKISAKIVPNLPKVGGLTNLGNTCFFNAVLQCLAQTPFLVKVLEDLRLPGQKFVLPGGKHKPNNSDQEIDLPPIEGTLERWGSFTSILWKTLTEMQNTTGHQTYCPLELLTAFKKKTMQCMDGGQHDSHELLRHLLEIVRNEDLRRYQLVILKEVGLNGKTDPVGVDDSLKSRIKFYGNQANARLLGPELVFRGVLVSTLECLECHHSSQSTEPFLDVSLPVMAFKPQPPVLKRKNSGLEDAMETTTPSKHQLKKEKKAARKNRKNRRHQPNPEPGQAVQEENNGPVLESEESDADVEDNVEVEVTLPEVGESGYASEKPSALGSPVLWPSSRRFWPIKRLEPLSGFSLDPYLPLCAVEPQSRPPENTVMSPSPTDISVTEPTSRGKLSDRLESSGSLENEPAWPELQLFSSLAVNSDLTSPESPTASLSSMTSKESPGSPEFVNGEKRTAIITTAAPITATTVTAAVPTMTTTGTATPATTTAATVDTAITTAIMTIGTGTTTESMSIVETAATMTTSATPLAVVSAVTNEEKDSMTEEDRRKKLLEALRAEVRLHKENHNHINNAIAPMPPIPLPAPGTSEGKDSSEVEVEISEKHLDDLRVDRENFNFENGLTAGISRLSIAGNQSPTRYATKEGECSVQSCLNQFTALELMSGSNNVSCQSCTERERRNKGNCKMVCTPSTKQYLIRKVPAVLILHLKRFQAQRVDFRKVTKHVSFPMLLDLAPVCKDHRKSRVYALYGVVEHSGTIHGGHYVAYVKSRIPLASGDPRWAFLPSKDPKDTEDSDSDSEMDEAAARPATTIEPPPGKWYHVSDSRVSEVDEQTVLQSQAYLLFYERIL